MLRRIAIRGVQYDGSRWELHNSYETEKAALEAIKNLRGKQSVNFPSLQYKIEQHEK